MGHPIITAPDFRPNPARGSLSSSHRAAPTAVAAHIHKGCLAGLYAVINEETADQCIPERNEISLGITPKKGKPSARPTCNPSSNASRQPPFLNTPEAVEMARIAWGAIEHPTVLDLIQMLVQAANTHGWDNIVMWKGDLKGAYTLLRLRPSQVHLLSARLANGFLTLPLWGNFGWAPLVFAFQVVTRIVVAVGSVAIVGLLTMYVDDFIGVSPRSSWTNDRETVVDIIRRLLGDDAEETSKRESTEDNDERTLVALGWSFNLSSRTVDVATHNRAKAIYRFATLDLNNPVPRKDLQAVCSLAQRYALVHTELGVLMPDLNRMLAGWTAQFQKITVPPRSRTAIQLWLAYLVVEHLKDSNHQPRGRPFADLAVKTPRAVVEFDGSLSGVGVRVFLLPDGIPAGHHRESLLASMSAPIQFDCAGDSTYQNTAELIALTMGLLLLGRMGYSHLTVHARGDSISVLEWTVKNRSTFRSTVAQNAIMVFMAVKRHYALNMDQQYTHLSSEANHICDALSRGRSVNNLTTVDTHPAGVVNKLIWASSPLANVHDDDPQRFTDKLRGIYGTLEDKTLPL